MKKSHIEKSLNQTINHGFKVHASKGSTTENDHEGFRQESNTTRMGRGRNRVEVSTRVQPAPSKVYHVPWSPILPPSVSTLGKKRVGAKPASSRALHVTTLFRDVIQEIPEFFTDEETEAWISYGERCGFEACFHTETKEYAHRDNGRIEFVDSEVAAALFRRLKPMVPQEINARNVHSAHSRIRLYRYEHGQRFGKHIDENNLDPVTGATSEITVLVYLNGGDDEYRKPIVGGETIFYRDSYGDKVVSRVVPKRGHALLHGHGARCLTHEAAAVAKGAKVWSLPVLCIV